MSKININIKNNLSRITKEILDKVNLMYVYSVNINENGQIYDLVNTEKSYTIGLIKDIIEYVKTLVMRGYSNILTDNNNVTLDILIFNNLSNSMVSLISIKLTDFVDFNLETKELFPKPINEIYNDTMTNVVYIEKIKKLTNELNNAINIINNM